MPRINRQRLDGILSAMIVVAKVTGKQPMKGMTDREWKLICHINRDLAKLAADEAACLDN